MTYSGKTHGERRVLVNKTLGALLGVALSVGFAGSLLAHTTAQAQADPVVAQADSSTPYLRDIFIDQVPILTPTFSPDVHTYTGTIYRTPQSITVKPMMSDGSNTATVNGRTMNESDQRVRIPVHEGLNTITVKSGSQTYTLNLTKVDTDYYGRKPIDPAGFSIQQKSHAAEPESGHELEKMWMMNTGTGAPKNFYRAQTRPQNAANHYDPSGTWWILDLGRDYNISKLFVKLNTAWHPRENGAPRPRFGNTMAIDFKASNVNYFSPALNSASLGGGPDGINHVYFPKSITARYLRFTWMTLGDTTGNPYLYDLQVFQDTDPSLINGDLKRAPQATQAVAPSEKGVNRGQSKFVDTGIMWSGWAPSGGYGRPTFTNKELAEWGNDLSMTFYDPVYSSHAYPLSQEKVNTLTDTAQTNDDYLRTHPNAKWGLALAPFNVRDLNELGNMEAKEFLGALQKKYIGNATTFQFGDEAPWHNGDADVFKKWFDYSREHYPNALLHSNQAVGFWKEANYKEYIQKAHPDLLTFDYYPYRNRIPWAKAGSVLHDIGRVTDGWNITPFFLNVGTWNLERKVALDGYDGQGQQPIPFGQYLDAFNLDGSQSQKGYFANLSLATGMKWLGFFLFEHHWDGSFLWDVDDQPTHAFHEYAKIKREVDKVSPYLARLNNTYVVDQPGQHKENNQATGATVSNPIPGVSGNNLQANNSLYKFAGFAQPQAESKNQEYGVTGISAVNKGFVNNGLPGDVVVGYFDALPGLKTQYLQDKFGVDAPKALYVTNGLVDPVHLDRDHQADWKSQRIDNGSKWQTAQDVTLTLRKDMNRKLMLVDPKTGEPTEPTLVVDSQGNPTITLHLDGGSAALLYWGAEGKNPTRQAEPEAPAPAPVTPPVAPQPPAPQPDQPTPGPSEPKPNPAHPSEPGDSGKQPVTPHPSEPHPSEPGDGSGKTPTQPDPSHPSEPQPQPGEGGTPAPHPSEPGTTPSPAPAPDPSPAPSPSPAPGGDKDKPNPAPSTPTPVPAEPKPAPKPEAPSQPAKPEKPENPVKENKDGKKDDAKKDADKKDVSKDAKAKKDAKSKDADKAKLAKTGSSITVVVGTMFAMATLAGAALVLKRRESL